MADRKSLSRKYKETPRPAGVYRVRHTPSGRTLVGSSADAPAMLNRIRAQLRTGSHRNRALQDDWNADGPDAFSFEVLDLLTPSDGVTTDLAEELATLVDLWMEKLSLPERARY